LRVSLFLIFIVLKLNLLAENYCIFIDKLDLNTKNNSKIHSILDDIAYPSIKLDQNIIFIYSGKFKTAGDAGKLLPLTKSRYKHAKVALCDDTKLYNNTSQLTTTVPQTEQKAHDNSSYYCLQVFESSLIQSAKQKDKINSILNKLPQTHTKVMNGKFFIYSGEFDTKQSAQTIANILQKEFKKTKVTECQRDIVKLNLSHKNKNIVKETLAPEQTNKMQKFSLSQLDGRGLISKEISSINSQNKNKNIQKSDIRHALDTQREEHFSGLYLKANGAYDTLNNDTAYDVRVEFDIFQQGYYENKKKNEKDKIDNQLTFLKTLKNISILQRDQELLKVRKYENSINVSALLLKLRVMEGNLNRADRQSKSGLITSYEYENYKLAIQQIKDELLLFKNMSLLKIPKNLWILLNQIEYVKLIDDNELIDALEKDSIDLKLAKTLQEKRPLMDEWSDKLRVNLYAGGRKMYLAQQQTLIGIEAKIPISNYSRTKELDTIQNDIMSDQVRLQHNQAKEILKDAIATFKYKQQKLKTYAYELTRIKKRIKELDIINSSAFASYANISFNAEQKTMNNYLEKYTATQLARINTYKELINIMYLIHTNEIKDILKYAIEK